MAARTGPTPCQLRILGLVARGETNQEIAAALGVAESTVKNQLRGAYLRLGAWNRTSAVVAAMRSGDLRISRR